ncbi:neutral alpha-glucosidase C isoform X2 [Anoplophora glabripennis]|uniref:neutral alpha-glucosidase C isoform X2 n=1 Tax=Anoplophora glabripennis TaxID=217634 RepID=UPI0008751265|nr:neutral alpha-glucosidase C isoform X2 [Anoplophora glabripennis]
MIRFLILLAFCASAYGADHNLFKNCTRIPFCAKLRDQTVDAASQFALDMMNFKKVGEVAYFSLINEKNEALQLQISLLKGNQVRIKIAEVNHSRHELVDALDGEPDIISIDNMIVMEDSISMTNSPSTINVTVQKGPPFAVVLYYGEGLQLMLNGNRLVMENSDDSKAFAFEVNFVGASKLYGLYHHAYKLALGKTADGSSDPFRLRNSDTAGYEVGSTMALYGSIPAIYGHSSNKTVGIFLNNAAEQWVDIDYEGDELTNGSAYFMVESGTLDLFLLPGPTPKDVVRQYTNLTGVAHLPQLWTLGYHQCRWSYMTQEDVKDVVANMVTNDFPMDAIWLDIDYTEGKRYFTWNPDNFSDPIEMQKNISYSGKKLVTILDPHIKVDEDYPVYVGAKDYFVKWANGTNFQGDCWPGLSSYLDFLNPEARDYYASWYSYEKFQGTTETLAGIWNDMNEPSVFDDSLEKTLPFETIHYGNILHRDVHNIYGLMQTKATHQGLMQRDNGTKRPFVLTRSHFAGSQRYAAMWTGDNTAGWDYLAISYAECLISNILGMVFCGADIGGFAGNPEPELLQRWYQAGAWFPFYRGHAENISPRREPYLYSKDVQEVIRNAIKLRYKHIPVWYTLFYEHTRYGDPVIRPLFYHYSELLELETHLLLGSDILVRPVVEAGVTSVAVNFPGTDEIWYRVDDESWSVHTGNTVENVIVTIKDSPVYYKGGSIIVRKDTEKLSTREMRDDPYTLYVNVDLNNSAEGRIYLDDYTSFDYLNNNQYLYMNMVYIPATRGLRFEVIDGDAEGLSPVIQRIVISEPTENGVRKTVYTTTSNGTALGDIDFVKQMRTLEGRDLILRL